MTDQERITTLERELVTVKTDLLNMGAALTLLKAKVDAKVPPPTIRGGQPVFG